LSSFVGFFGRDLLAFVWAEELLAVLWPALPLKSAALAAFCAYLAMAVWRAQRRSQITALVLALAGWAVFPAEGGAAAIEGGLRFALIFGAFLPTMFLARATADQNPEIERSRAAFTAIAPPRRSTGFLIGSHALGGILTAGTFAVVSAILPRDADEGERRRAALASLRGMNLSVLWSPFFVAMAVASHHVVGVPLWQTAALGLPLAAIGLAIAYAGFGGTTGGWPALAQAAEALVPVVPLIAIAGFCVVLVTGLTQLTSLQAVLLTVPPLCLLDIVRRGRRGFGVVAMPILAVTRASLGRINDDMVLATAAMVFGRVLEANPAITGFFADLAALGLPVVIMIAAAMAFMLLGSVAGVHPIVTMTLVLVTLGGEASRLAPVVLLELGLYGWSLGTMISMSSVSIAIAAAMFRVPVPSLAFAENLRFVLIFGLLSALLLALVNTWLWA
jgi:hypothetical protein